MHVVAAGTAFGGWSLKPHLPIVDPADVEPVPWAAGTRLEGDIALSEPFPDLEEVVEKEDVVIFWTYVFCFANAPSSERLGGWLVIPRGGIKREERGAAEQGDEADRTR